MTPRELQVAQRIAAQRQEREAFERAAKKQLEANLLIVDFLKRGFFGRLKWLLVGL